MPDEVSPARVIAIVGGSGYLGQVLTRALLADRRGIERILLLDLRPPPQEVAGQVVFDELDVRSARLGEVLAEHAVDTVVHLAAVVTPRPGMTRNEHYAIDVDGTHNVLDACVEHGVQQVIVTSSGAAYGYHVDNPAWLDEQCPLRGNEEFAYARHKRLVEELLARYRARYPALRQLIFRPGTVLGRDAHNPVTALFERSVLLRITDGDSRFVFVWDEDVALCIAKGIHERRSGVFNLAGDGAMTPEEIASITGARVIALPATVLAIGLRVARWFELTDHGPEQVPFLRYRPVLSNAALKRDFGYTPLRTSREAFEEFWRSRRPQ
ncbi:MAG: SDR family oxidoreductase [Gemmatimonadaceae bacterium]|nr:SDR family oxidoreductase [Gemmatimonadaceae bacterium]